MSITLFDNLTMKMMMLSFLRSLILIVNCSVIFTYKYKANGLINHRNVPISIQVEKFVLKAHAAPFDSPESLRDMVDR